MTVFIVNEKYNPKDIGELKKSNKKISRRDKRRQAAQSKGYISYLNPLSTLNIVFITFGVL